MQLFVYRLLSPDHDDDGDAMEEEEEQQQQEAQSRRQILGAHGPIRGQHSGQVITLDQSEAGIQVK